MKFAVERLPENCQRFLAEKDAVYLRSFQVVNPDPIDSADFYSTEKRNLTPKGHLYTEFYSKIEGRIWYHGCSKPHRKFNPKSKHHKEVASATYTAVA